MTVVSEGPLCLKIHLNKTELKKYFTSYSKIHFNDPNIKRTIYLLFEAAITSAEFETTGKRIIEVFPTASGGCILKFTCEPLPKLNTEAKKPNLRLKSKTEKNNPYIFAFKNFEDLLGAIFSVKNADIKNYKSSLFTHKSKYYLKIFIPIFDIKSAILINEFSTFSTKGSSAEAVLNEYTKCLIDKNAVDVLIKAFKGL